MTDHPILVDLWKTLKAKHNIALFLDTENLEEDAKLVLDWFEPLTKKRFSLEAQMENGFYLCIRKVLKVMPPINEKTQGEYIVKVATKKDIESLKESLND